MPVTKKNKNNSKKRKIVISSPESSPPSSPLPSSQTLSDTDDEDYFPNCEYKEYFPCSDRKRDQSSLERAFGKEGANRFNNMMKEVTKREPTLKIIIETDLDNEARAELFQMYTILTEMGASAERWAYRDKFWSTLKRYKLFKSQPNSNESKTWQVLQEEEKKTQEKIWSFLLQWKHRPDIQKAVFSEFKRTEGMPETSEEKQNFNTWFHWIKRLPISNLSKPISVGSTDQFLKKAWQKMNDTLYGLFPVKRQIMRLLHAKCENPQSTLRPIAWIGPPGCGKSRMARLVAEILDKSFTCFNLSGQYQSENIDGSASMWVGSKPGLPVQSLCRIKQDDGIILIDEAEKTLNSDNSGSSLTSLLSLLDPEFNSEFGDKFIAHFTVDMSKIWWMLAMNGAPNNQALLDRLNPVYIPEYTQNEKKIIIKNYVLPRICKKLELIQNVNISDTALSLMIFECKNQGIRSLEKIIENILNDKKLFYTSPWLHKELAAEIEYKTPWNISLQDVEDIIKQSGKSSALNV